MQEKVKEYCYHELKMFKLWGGDVNQLMTRCYGAVMFVLYAEPDEDEHGGLTEWWDEEMHPILRELQLERR